MTGMAGVGILKKVPTNIVTVIAVACELALLAIVVLCE